MHWHGQSLSLRATVCPSLPQVLSLTSQQVLFLVSLTFVGHITGESLELDAAGEQGKEREREREGEGERERERERGRGGGGEGEGEGEREREREGERGE